MNREELDSVLSQHTLWLTGEGGVRANLSSADLRSADLSSANLRSADLSYTVGCCWAAIGPVGQGHQMLTAYQSHGMTVPVITGGCFSGTFAEFRETISGTPWDWATGTPEQIVGWRTECSDAADLLQLSIARQQL